MSRRRLRPSRPSRPSPRFVKYAAAVAVMVAVVAALLIWHKRDGDGDGFARSDAIDGRWYSAEQVAQGAKVYEANCMACHNKNASGTKDWKKRLPNGAYPPPPLDGTAHTWHHPLAQLRRTIKQGTIPIGGQMPPFADKLTQAERDAVIAYFQSLWPDEIYQTWATKVNRRQ